MLQGKTLCCWGMQQLANVCYEREADIVFMWKTGGFSIRFSALLDYINDLQHLVLAPQQLVALDDADFFFPTLLVTIRYMPAC